MPRQFANVMVLSLVAIGVAGLMLSTFSAIEAEGVSHAERIGLIALWVAVLHRVSAPGAAEIETVISDW